MLEIFCKMERQKKLDSLFMGRKGLLGSAEKAKGCRVLVRGQRRVGEKAIGQGDAFRQGVEIPGEDALSFPFLLARFQADEDSAPCLFSSDWMRRWMSLPDSRAFPEWSTTETRIFRWSGISTPAQTEAGMSTPNFRYTKRERALMRDSSPFSISCKMTSTVLGTGTNCFL